MSRTLSFFTITAVLTCVLLSCHGSGTGNDTTMYEVSVTVSPEEAGMVSPSPDSSFEAGEEIELQAQPNGEYLFAGWSGSVESSENPLSLTVDSEYSLTAKFELKTYPLTVTTEGEGAVIEQVVEQKAREYEQGTVVELITVPAEGWHFVKWKGALTGRENPAQITVDTPKEVTAVFEQFSFYLAANGVTIMCPEAEVGSSGTVSGAVYTKRSKDQITPTNAAITCTSGITDMSSLFLGATEFNGDISSWDVSSVTDMSQTFEGAESFDRDISDWDMSNVTDMRRMFLAAEAFNQDIGGWNVSNVLDMEEMFFEARAFNQDIGKWDVSSVINMNRMFYGTPFNQDLGSWDVSNVKSMVRMFGSASSFNGDISTWDVSNVTSMFQMFYGAGAFNQDISNWNVNNVTDMGWMLRSAQSFNQDIGSWDVSNVTDMSLMFYNASSFNQDLSGWCVSNIASEPGSFSLNAPLTDAHKPEWGTCPD